MDRDELEGITWCLLLHVAYIRTKMYVAHNCLLKRDVNTAYSMRRTPPYTVHGNAYSVYTYTGFVRRLLIRSTVYGVQCMGYSVRRTVYAVQCIGYSVRRTVYRVQCTPYSVWGTVYALQCMGYSVRRTVYAVQCKGYSVWGTVYAVQCKAYSVRRTV